MRIGMAIDLVPGCGAFTSGVSYEAEATALFARFSTDPGTTRKNAINTCIASLKTAGVWSKLDCLYVFAAHNQTDAKLNWIENADNLTESGTLIFTTDDGFTAGSTNPADRLEGSRNIDTLTNYTQNSAHISAWCKSLSSTDPSAAVRTSTASGVNLFPRFTDNNAYLRINDSPETGGFSSATITGHTLGNRSSSTARQGYKDGVSIGTYFSEPSTARPAELMYYIAGASNTRINAATVGGSLTSGEVTSLYNALNTLKSAIGW